MKDICEVCKKPAVICCSCDYSLRFCFKDCFQAHQFTKGDHKGIDLATRRKEINEKFICAIENLNNLKSKIISRSKLLIQTVQLITSKNLSMIEKYIYTCEDCLKSRDLDIEKMFEGYQNFKIQELDLKNFEKIVDQNFVILEEKKKNITTKVNSLLNDLNINSVEFLKTVEELKNKLESNLYLFLEIYNREVKCVAVTSDNKHMISCSGRKVVI